MRGRKTTLPPGTILNGYTVTDLPSTYRGTNRLIQVRCNTCGTLRQCWTSALRNDRVKCVLCGKKDTEQSKRLAETLPRVAVYPDRLVLLTGDEMAPPDCILYKFVLPDLALPYKEVTVDDSAPPEPDSGWHYALKVPAQWLDFYCETGDLNDDQMQKAIAYFDEHVFSPTPLAYSICSKGSGTVWTENGQRWAYLYWRDHSTWLRSGPAPASYVSKSTRKPGSSDSSALSSGDWPDLHNHPPEAPTSPENAETGATPSAPAENGL